MNRDLDLIACFFGEPWNSGICREREQAPTPTGEKCWWCETEIKEGDRGTWNPFGNEQDKNVTAEPLHRECLVRIVNGPPEHLRGECCIYGAEKHVLPETSAARRKEAVETWEVLFSAGT